jgi:hypothetical protein
MLTNFITTHKYNTSYLTSIPYAAEKNPQNISL